MSWLRRLANTFRTGRLRGDIDRELAFHVAERADELRSGGVSDEEARRLARVQLGNPGTHLERTLDMDAARALETSFRNLRFAARAPRRTPGFTLTVVLTLALGIGANAAVFSTLNAVLLRALRYPEADRLVQLTQFVDGAGETPTATVRLREWSRVTSTFVALTGHTVEDVSDTSGDVPERVRLATVLPDFLPAWGVVPVLGRGFTEGEHHLGGAPAVMISEGYWRQRLGGADDVLAAACGRPNARTRSSRSCRPRSLCLTRTWTGGRPSGLMHPGHSPGPSARRPASAA
jgi:putative ABC transport system permease protein